jgi:formylglycine-generating enzyme required for sulfatase activity
MTSETELVQALADARERTDELFELVRPDSLYERPIPERHRIIFYLGHMEAFDWNLLGRYAFDVRPFLPEFDRLFAFGIDPPPGRLPEDQPSDWPALAEVGRYVARVRDEVDELAPRAPEQLVHVAVEHRLMHAETLAYMLHQLPYERKRPPAGLLPPSTDTVSGDARMIDIPAGSAQLGRDQEDGFGWDNEFRAHDIEVPGFAIGKHKVTNGDYLEFVREGADPPFFWTERNGRWFYRGMFSEMPLPLSWPVYVTMREAESYARWRRKRLPTEAEFHRAASPPKSGNFDFRGWEPCSVNESNGNDGPAQMYGNGWEWTSTTFAPFPGFKAFPFYQNYSEPFFDGQHYVLKGASPRTARCFLRDSFRNWFRPEYPYIYATFRLVES